MSTIRVQRLLPGLLLAGIVLSSAQTAVAQAASTSIYFRPHCEETDQTKCAAFSAQDPSTLATNILEPGAELDLDVAISNPTGESIRNARIWISYDASVLEGKTLTISPLFPTVIPGESNFTPSSGYVKMAASTLAGKEVTDAIIPFARVTFLVKPGATSDTTPLSFYDQTNTLQAHTIITNAAAPTQNLLLNPLGTLMVRMAVPAPASSAPSSISSASSVSSLSSLSSSGTVAATAFPLIQVQNVKVSTKDDILYVTWDPLSHPKLQGYNIYYGTLKGRYLQRRSVSIASRGMAVRDVPRGKTYYVSVRGVDDQNQETAFSAEASVEIGNPSTSTAPVEGTLDLIDVTSPSTVAPPNPLENIGNSLPASTGVYVPGETGAPSGILLLILCSAAIGTLLALRRQYIARVHAL